jgi:uncharacterized protein (TIGR02444 family)
LTADAGTPPSGGSSGPDVVAARNDIINPFWRFSLAVYAAPSVAAECLLAQEALNIDVNCLLYCAWVGAEYNAALSDDDILAIDRVTHEWHQAIVRPLRAVRQHLKMMDPHADDAAKKLRADVARNELFAEQIEQHLLFWSTDPRLNKAARAAPDQAIRGNVTAFLLLMAKAKNVAEPPVVERLIDAAIAYRKER